MASCRGTSGAGVPAGSQTRLSGDIGTETTAAVPKFTVTVARRIGE
jgi:hypothetical protein